MDATAHRFAILFGSDVPADAAAGYNFQTSSDGVQTLSFWYNNTGASAFCGSTPMTGNVIPMSFCAGSGIFSTFLTVETTAPELNVSVWAQAGAGTVPAHAHYTTKSCTPISVVSPMNPFGGGAMALVMRSSSGVAPPASLFALPPACSK